MIYILYFLRAGTPACFFIFTNYKLHKISNSDIFTLQFQAKTVTFAQNIEFWNFFIVHIGLCWKALIQHFGESC
jgi:hypothetical protein